MEPQQYNDSFSDWRRMYDSHPQSVILKKHIERATHDIFFASLKKQSIEFFFLFETKDQIEKFLEKMLEYWENEEEYEKCIEVVELGKSLVKLWENREDEEYGSSAKRFVDWLNSSI